MANLLGTYAGTVEDDRDPDQIGRMKVRVPTVYGPANLPTNAVPTSDIPWALPVGLPAGATPQSGMIGWLPTIGDHVFVRFLDGEPEKPIWEWGMQDISQQQAYPAWTRQPGGYTSTGTDANGNPSVTPPQSAVLTRYGHSFDFQPDTTTWRTAQGFFIRFTDSAQQLDIYAPNMVLLLGSVKFGGKDIQFLPSNTFTVSTATTNISSTTNSINGLINTITAVAANKIVAPCVQLGPEGKAYDPVVRLSDVATLIASLILQFSTHVHIATSIGAPTTPPVVPLLLSPTASNTTFTA